MEKSIYQVTKDGFLQYGPYINNSRHLPLVFDGLKPSYRRTIYGALVLCGGSNKFVKTAQLSGYVIGNFHPHGNCICGDTLVYSRDGQLRRIKDLYESGVECIDTVSYDEETKEFVPSQAQLFRLGAESKVKYRIEINGKYSIECTENHKFLISDNVRYFEGRLLIGSEFWVQAKNLEVGMYLNSTRIGINFIDYPISNIDSCFITKVERIELDEVEQFYDFTVPKYNSMMIPLNTDPDDLHLINVHNSSVEGVITELVHAGILEGQGNFGSVTILGDAFEQAAPRYTEVRLNPNWHSIFSELLPFVEWEDSYIGVKMPSYLPTPIPISLLFGSIGIGFGTGCLIPNFTAKSMYEAFKSNDPYKLKPAFRDIEFNYDKSEFEVLWDLGWARMTYVPTVHRGSAPDCGDGIYVKCDPSFIVPNMPLINERVRQDRLFIRDESDSNGDKLFIGRYPKLHEDMGYYEKYIKDTVEVSDTYRLVCTDGHAASLISLKTWLKLTYSRYLKYIEKMKSTKIAKIDKEIRVLSILPKVGELIQSNKNISESQVIANFPDFDPADVRTCLGKPIRKLMKSEHESEINALRNQRNSIESINPDTYTTNILDKM